MIQKRVKLVCVCVSVRHRKRQTNNVTTFTRKFISFFQRKFKKKKLFFATPNSFQFS